MQNLTRTEEGKRALTSFLKFLIKGTKQDNLFQVIFASSDSFYHNWLVEHLKVGYFNNIFIGNMSKSHSETYFCEYAVAQYPDLCPISFESAYNVCGGSVHFLDM